MKILIAKAYPKITFDGVLAMELKRRGHTVHMLLPECGADAEKLSRAGIVVHANPVITTRYLRRDSLRVDALNFYKLIALLAEEKYDIINLHLPAARLFGRLASLFAGRRCVVSVMHGLEAHHERWTNWIDSATVCVSQTVKNYLIKTGLPAHKLQVIYNGLDCEAADRIPPDKFYLHRQLGLGQKIRFIGMVAYFYQPRDSVDKGHKFFIDAAGILSSQYPDVRFVIVGSDRLVKGEEQRFRAYAAGLGLADKIYFLGERDDIFNVMDSFYVHVLPSLKEGFGLVVAEAMARGIPNIASGLNNIREIITEEHNGILFEPGQTGQLVKALRDLLEHTEKAARIGRLGREHVLAKLKSADMARKYEELFIALLKSKQGQDAR